MVPERSRKARGKLLRKYRFGAVGHPGNANVKINRIEVSGPDEVVVGDEFRLIVTTEPDDVNATVLVTVEAGTPYSYEPRRSTDRGEKTESSSRGHEAGALGFQEGLFLPWYGLANVVNGMGEIRATQYTPEGFRLRVTLGEAEATWSISREHVRCNDDAATADQAEPVHATARETSGSCA